MKQIRKPSLFTKIIKILLSSKDEDDKEEKEVYLLFSKKDRKGRTLLEE